MYDVILIGAGAAGIFAAYEFAKDNPGMDILMIEKGYALEKRFCPKTKNPTIPCKCKTCSIMEGFYGAGGFSDGKYNITNNFGGELYRYIGEKEAIDLMWYVDQINLEMGGAEAKLYSTGNSTLKAEALKHDLHLLDAKVRHLGTDRNFVIAGQMYDYIKDKMTILFETEAETVEKVEDHFLIKTKDQTFEGKKLILATGRTGSNWINKICDQFGIETENNRVDIGVRVELPALVFKEITDQVYESKIVYRTDRYNDLVRTFCMNPYGEVVTENYGDIVTVNGHSYSDPSKHTENTNFALLVTNKFTEPFKNSNEYGEHIARLSNMLGGGVIMQRFGDLIKGRRSSKRRMLKCFTTPTLHATPGDLSLVLPKRQLDNIVEMIYALDKIAPGTANEDTLLYGVEVKFYNSMVEVDQNLETIIKGLYILGDCSGVTHSLSQAAASGIYVAQQLKEAYKNNEI